MQQINILLVLLAFLAGLAVSGQAGYWQNDPSEPTFTIEPKCPAQHEIDGLTGVVLVNGEWAPIYACRYKPDATPEKPNEVTT